MQLSVVIPTYNEAENLPNLVSALFGLPIVGLGILIVDDNSPDGTGKLADDLAESQPGKLSVLHRPCKMGLGTAYVQGFQKVLEEGAEAICQMDADFSHPPELLMELVSTLEDCDVVLGSRYVPGGSVDTEWPYWRKGLSAFGNFYARTILRLPVRDATGGYRVWSREALMGIPLDLVRSNGYAFQVEMTYIACKLGYCMKEIPFYFADRKWGHSKMSFRVQREAAIRVWQLLFEYRKLRPKSHRPDS